MTDHLAGEKNGKGTGKKSNIVVSTAEEINEKMSKRRILVWFRNDLRVRDNATLINAVKEGDEVIPFYCFDDHYYQVLPYGFPKTGSFRASFIRESVSNLRENLEKRGGSLIVRKGNTAHEIKKINDRFPLHAIYFSEEVTHEEIVLGKEVEILGIPVKKFWNSTLYHKNDLPFEEKDIPWVFTDFRKKLEKYSRVRAEEKAPGIITLPEEIMWGELPALSELGLTEITTDPRRVLAFKGGEKQAWQRLEEYFWQKDLLKGYKQTRNGLLGPDYSSKFSPWLALGCISPISIYCQVQDYEQKRQKNSSTYWLVFELIWRDFFRFTAQKEGNYFFRRKERNLPEVGKSFDNWRKGKTGQTFVDANMIELMSTGFMSNRGRQNVASYLIYDLKQPWYAGAAWFESQLIDYDVCSNYGNWTYIAGIGHDPRKGRYFKVDEQAERYDPQGEYIGLWLEKRGKKTTTV